MPGFDWQAVIVGDECHQCDGNGQWIDEAGYGVAEGCGECHFCNGTGVVPAALTTKHYA